MQFVTLVLFSVLCSSACAVGPYYEYLRQDEAVNDDVSDDDNTIKTLNGDDNRNEGVDDDDDRLGDTIDAIKSSAGNSGMDDNDEGVNDDDDGIDGNDEVADKNDSVNDDDDGILIPSSSSSSSGNDEVTDKKESLTDDDDGIDENDGVDDGNDSVNDEFENKKLNKWRDGVKKSGNDELDVKQYQQELAAGDLSELLGNSHHDQPWYYKDLSRRFVPVYPYKKRANKHLKPNPEDIIRLLLSPKRKIRDDEESDTEPIRFPKRSLRDDEDTEVVPIRAPPELVLAVMRNGTNTYASKPSEHTEEVIRQYMLRSGDYWDNVWKEEVVPSSDLRTKKHQKQSSNNQPILGKLVPGTKLYELLARIVKKTPKLVYIINN